MTTADEAPTRRSQVDRTNATRAALEEATIEVLLERGWAQVTVAEITERAGVTAGAFHHHYPSRPAHFAAALKRLYNEMQEPKRAAPATLLEAIERIWAAVGNPRFKAVIEAWLATANDPTLKDEVGPIVGTFSKLVDPTIPGNHPLITSDNERDFYLMARETMLGLALGRATNGGKALAHEARVLDRLRAQAVKVDGARNQ